MFLADIQLIILACMALHGGDHGRLYVRACYKGVKACVAKGHPVTFCVDDLLASKQGNNTGKERTSSGAPKAGLEFKQTDVSIQLLK